MLLPDWLSRRAQLSPTKVALIDAASGREVSYRAWNASATRTAAWLREGLGVGVGDRVAVLARNSISFLDVWFALGKMGAILQPLNWRLTASELAALLALVAPVALLYDDELAPTVEALRGQAPSVRHWLPMSAIDERERFPDEAPMVEISPDMPWVICHTGGTTGAPKGAILTHGNILWNAINTIVSWGLSPDDVTLLNAPLFHSGGLNVFTAPLVYLGGTSIVGRDFDLDLLFDLIERRAITIWFGVPAMFIAMQQHPRWERADFSGMKLLISGGAPCPLPIFERFWARGLDFKSGYGLTEAGPNTFWLPAEDVRRKPGAVGFPLMHVDVRVVDEAGAECPPDTVGELLVRGPHVTPGYWGDPEATAEVIRDGWLHTGDLARRDGEGCYTIVGRLKELIISGGENIYPAEVESVLAAHPSVAEVALIGIPDERWGEVGCAIVVPAAPLDVEELLAFARERLARYKVPKRVICVESLPKTGARKVDRLQLERVVREEF